jgi:hypothetical protein
MRLRLRMWIPDSIPVSLIGLSAKKKVLDFEEVTVYQIKTEDARNKRVEKKVRRPTDSFYLQHHRQQQTI